MDPSTRKTIISRDIIFLEDSFQSSYIEKDSGSQPKHELIMDATNSVKQLFSGETMSMDSNHHEEKDGGETLQGNEDILDKETAPIEERRYNLRDPETGEFSDFVAYSVFSKDIDEPLDASSR
ncbi:hypothetical protein JTB14_037990 [Gonioctena quinquepunctata]|nr:hypothetical protein JTB14_037990 [Gonioctena quinquepunctata]